MNDWKRDMERAEYAVSFREETDKVKPKAGQTIVSHTSMAEVQASDSVKQSIAWRTSDISMESEFD